MNCQCKSFPRTPCVYTPKFTCNTCLLVLCVVCIGHHDVGHDIRIGYVVTACPINK
jgi:hypothetical protein